MGEPTDNPYDEGECRHGMATGTCSICKEPEQFRSSGRRPLRGSPQTLDTPASVEKYRERYSQDRYATFDAYVDVYFRDVKHFPGRWTHFSRCASAQEERVKNAPEQVSHAEQYMRVAGYEADDSGREHGRGRRWFRRDL
jgi:hypothetical protein